MATYDELLNDSKETGEVEASPAAIGGHEAKDPQDSPESSVPTEKLVPLKALEETRHKAQGYEQIVLQQQQQIDALMRALQQPANPVQPQRDPDPILETAQWQQALFQRVEQVMNERDQRIWTRQVTAAEEDMRESHADYDQLVDTYFRPAAQNDPSLVQGLRNAANPAKYAYRVAKRIHAEQSGDLDPAKLREKIRAELLAELEGKQAELENLKIPVSLGKGNNGVASSNTGRIPLEGKWRATELYGD